MLKLAGFQVIVICVFYVSLYCELSNSSSCSRAPFTSRRAVGGTVIRLGGTGVGAPVDGGAKSNMGV